MGENKPPTASSALSQPTITIEDDALPNISRNWKPDPTIIPTPPPMQPASATQPFISPHHRALPPPATQPYIPPQLPTMAHPQAMQSFIPAQRAPSIPLTPLVQSNSKSFIQYAARPTCAPYEPRPLQPRPIAPRIYQQYPVIQQRPRIYQQIPATPVAPASTTHVRQQYPMLAIVNPSPADLQFTLYEASNNAGCRDAKKLISDSLKF